MLSATSTRLLLRFSRSGPTAAAAVAGAALPTSLRTFSSSAPASSAFPGREEASTNKAERTMTRFWKTVTLVPPSSGRGEEGYTIHLDHRALKTPGGAKLVIPKHRALLASLVAQEWSEQTRTLKSHMLPLTSLAARAIDGCSDPQERKKICKDLLKYLETDTVLFYESTPDILVRLQSQHWDPLLSWASSRFSVPLSPFTSLLGNSHDPSVLPTFSSLLDTLDAFELAAFERAVLTTKSFLIPVALLSGHLDVEQAAQAAEVEVASQIQRWGEVEDSHDVDTSDLRRVLGSVAAAVVRN
ncbi:ATP synthase mitochondrial F1 complex assembly factor 2 [Thecaphora frezii]